MFSVNNVRALLDAHLAAVQGLPDLVTENVTYDATSAPYVMSAMLGGPTQVAAMGDGSPVLRMSGGYQVSLVFPAGVGMDDINVLADAILAAFYPGTVNLTDGSTFVRVNNIQQLTGYVDESLSFILPVQVDWSAYVTAN